MEVCGLPDVSCRHNYAGICACAGFITSGLLLLMVANISIEGFRMLSRGDAKFAAIDPLPPVDLTVLDDGIEQI